MKNKIRNILIVFIITLATHTLTVANLPHDIDEPIYVGVAVDYARTLERGDFDAVIDYPKVREHPALVKLVYGIVIYLNGTTDNYTEALQTARVVSAVFGVLGTILMALLDPLAGGIMGIHALVVKYTSQAYLDTIPLAMTIVSISAFLKTDREKPDRWFWLSAFALGASTAGKFNYTPALVVALAYLAFIEKKIPFRWMAGFGALAVASFFLLNVTLWHDPFNRIMEALEYHVNYQRGEHVAEVGYSWYQPFVWLFISTPGNWHPGVFFYDIDPFIVVFAFAGIKREWMERRWLVVWVVAGLLFLFLWGTKWPQYILTIVPAICLMAAESVQRFYKWFIHLSYYKSVG